MNFYLPLTVFCCSLGFFQQGFSGSALNVPEAYVEKFLIEAFKERYSIDLPPETATTLFSIAVSISFLGTLVGALFVGRVAEKFGRKRGLLYTQVFSIFAAIFMGCCKLAQSYEMLLIGRLSIGFSEGILIGIAQLYASEIAPIHIRGALIMINAVGGTTGGLIGYVLGLPGLLGGDDTWPVLLALIVVPSILQCIILPFMPDSPRYLILSKGKYEEAEDALKKLRNVHNVKLELVQILEEEQNIEGETKYSVLKLLMSNKLRLPLLLCVVLILSKIFSGYIALQYYSTSIFESAGIDTGYSQYVTICLGAVNLIMTIVTVFLIERLGRRTLHLTGLAGVIISSIAITISLMYRDFENSGVFLVLSAALFVIFYGTLKVQYIAMVEIFTQGPRSAAVSICIFVMIIGQIPVTLIYPQMQIYLLEYSFLPFMIIEVMLFIFLFIYLPETKNMTSRDISLIFQTPNAFMYRKTAFA